MALLTVLIVPLSGCAAGVSAEQRSSLSSGPASGITIANPVHTSTAPRCSRTSTSSALNTVLASPVAAGALLPGNVLAELQKKYPQFSRSEIIARQSTLNRSKIISERSSTDGSSGGQYFDYEKDIYWVYSIDCAGLERQLNLAEDAGVSARGALVRYSYQQLVEASADASAIATTASYFALTVDLEHNDVLVKLFPEDFRHLADGLRAIGPVSVVQVDHI